MTRNIGVAAALLALIALVAVAGWVWPDAAVPSAASVAAAPPVAPAHTPRAVPAAPSPAPDPLAEEPPVSPDEPWRAGGAVFADTICDKQLTCGCITAKPEICRSMWAWAGPEEADMVECLFDLSCEQLCHIDEGAPECFAAAKAMTERRKRIAP